ncbi:methyl-accepting chemotaxis protein [Candidatus Accumulibacter vicinus]|uniref:HAMP domain-containing protein n=1 Tax=Candidatus Accumulibacter vicinus TaxID=2954382 RepID=A0A084Y2K4_9PROT|nr:methyl-accepting chemotaxis protein [Candidatus Accumulibacter vicinus]KFB68948.1 MAG: hypothetical protein CAPSK01_001137 [Candidatus Accumulibacter vicinus]
MLKNYAISLRLALGFGLLTALVALMALTGVFQMSRINAHFHEITHSTTPQKEMALRLRIILDGRAIAARDVVLATEKADRTAAIERLGKLRDEFVRVHDKLDASLKSTDAQPQEFELLGRVMEANAKAKAVVDDLINLVNSGAETEARTAALAVRGAFDKVREALDAFSGWQDRQSETSMKDAADAYATAKTLLFALLALSLAIAVGGAVLITRSITRPVGQVLQAVETIAAGDLTVNLNPQGKDEIVRLEAGVKTMSEALRAAIGQVRGSADAVASTSGQLSGAA